MKERRGRALFGRVERAGEVGRPERCSTATRSGLGLLDDWVEVGRDLVETESLGLGVSAGATAANAHLGLDVVLAVHNGDVDGAAEVLGDGDRLVVGDLDTRDRELVEEVRVVRPERVSGRERVRWWTHLSSLALVGKLSLIF